MMQLNSNQIAEIIPHRYPFALVDRIVDGEVGKWAKGIKCVTVNEPFFQGHFPQYHVMPGVLIIEALAQVGAVTMLSMPENKGKIGLFGDGILYIITLRRIGGKFKNPKLLMNKAICRLYTISGNAPCRESITIIILIHSEYPFYFTPFIDKAMRLRFKSTSATLTITCS